MKRFSPAVAIATLLWTAPLAAQAGTPSPSPTSAAALTVRGLDGQERRFTAADLATLRRVDTTVAAHRAAGRYSGFLLTDLLGLVRAPQGDSLRGAALSNYIVVVGADGYRVVFALTDFDSGYTDRIAIIADRLDGSALPATEAPYRLIVPGEKRPARWVRQVVRIEVRSAP